MRAEFVLDGLSYYLQYSCRNDFDEETCFFYDNIDVILYHYKQYLTNNVKTLHRVMYEFRRIKKFNQFTFEVIDFIFNDTEEKLLSREYYELMNRFQKSKKVILKKLSHEH